MGYSTLEKAARFLRLNFGALGNQEWTRYCRSIVAPQGPRRHGAATLRSFLLTAWPEGACRDLPQTLAGPPLTWDDVQRQHLLPLGAGWVLGKEVAQACVDRNVDIPAKWNVWELPGAVRGHAGHPAWVTDQSL